MLWLAAALWSSSAWAQDPPPPAPNEAEMLRARELFDNGQILYDEGHYEDAIVAWEEAYRLTNFPELLYNISSAWEKLGDYRRALEVLNRYRAFAPASERETIDRRMKALEERLAASPPPVTPMNPPPVVDPPPVTPVAPSSRRSSPLPGVLLGVGGAGLAFGGVAGGLAWGALGEARDLCVDADGALLCPDAAEPAISRHGTWSTVSAASLAGGGALAAVGLVAVALGGGETVSVAVGPAGAALRVRGRF